MDEHIYPVHCGICEEPLVEGQEIAEMYDPTWAPEQPSVICHAECGANRGLEIA